MAREPVSLPERLMKKVYWSFIGDQFGDRAEFDRRVNQYQMDIAGSPWLPEEAVLHSPRIRVTYMCWQGDEQIEPVVEFASDNGDSFTAGELLYKLHNATVEQLREIDHHFFEGLDLHSSQQTGQTPLYVLRQGS